MELRFIERNGQRILQQLVEHVTPDGRATRFEWSDVPFVDDRIQVGPGGQDKLRAASDLVAERDTLRGLLNTAEAAHASNLRAARDAGKRELRRVETECDELRAELENQRQTAREWVRECKRLGEKLKTVEGVADYWRKECRALRDAVRAQGAHTTAEVFNTVIRIRSET